MNKKRLSTFIALAISILIFPLLIDKTAQLPLGPDGFVIVPGERWSSINDSGTIVGFSAVDDAPKRWTSVPEISAPVTGIASMPSPNANGWNNSPVTVTFVAVDEASKRSDPADSARSAIVYRYDSMGTLTGVSSDSLSSTVYTYDSAGFVLHSLNRININIALTDPDLIVDQGHHYKTLSSASISAAPMIAVNQPFQWRATQTLTVSRAGWYDLSTYSDVCGSVSCQLEVIWLPLPDASGDRQSKLTSEARSCWTTVLTTDGRKTSKDYSAAWIHLDGPGTLVVALATADARQANYTVGMHALSWGELIARMRNLSFVGVLLSMYLFRCAVVSCLWILSLVLLHRFTFWVLCQLPTRQRGAARNEIERLLWVAKWGGLASYAVWTIIDIAEFIRV
jgi:hypothetical protein